MMRKVKKAGTQVALPKHFKTKLTQLLQEEEIDLYVLTMHYRNDGDISYFNEPERRRVKGIFDILIEDTQRHAELLKGMVEADRE